MKKILILLISVLFFHCSDNKKNSIRYVEHRIDFLNWNLNIPENYIAVSFEDYQAIVRESLSDSVLISDKIEKFENLKKTLSEPYALFCDKSNIENIFLINYMLNPRPDKFLKEELAVEFHSDFKNKGKTEGYTYKPIENRLINNWLIKIKGEKTYNDWDRSIYNTLYFSSNFGAIVINTDKEVDFERELTQ